MYHKNAKQKLSLEDAKKLSQKEFDNLNDRWIYKLINRGRMTVQAARKMTEIEARKLKSEWIYELITDKKMQLSIDAATSLVYDKAGEFYQSALDNLNSKWVSSLIKSGQLVVEDAKKLTRNQFKRLNQEWISKLICKKKLWIVEAKDLSEGQCRILNNKWVYDLLCDDENSDIEVDIYQIIDRFEKDQLWIESRWIWKLTSNIRGTEQLSLKAARELTAAQVKILDNEWICALICRTHARSTTKFTIEEAKRLDDAEALRLGNKFIFELISERKLSIGNAKKLTDKELARLSKEPICKLICDEEVDMRNILMLPDDAFAELLVFASGRMKAGAKKERVLEVEKRGLKVT